jgi:hypothetical protein
MADKTRCLLFVWLILLLVTDYKCRIYPLLRVLSTSRLQPRRQRTLENGIVVRSFASLVSSLTLCGRLDLVNPHHIRRLLPPPPRRPLLPQRRHLRMPMPLITTMTTTRRQRQQSGDRREENELSLHPPRDRAHLRRRRYQPNEKEE